MSSLHDELEKKLQDANATPMFLPLQFLKAITCDFSTELELGRGGYGVVYKGVLRSGNIIAVKKLFEIHLLDDKTFQMEVSCLKEIKHRHVVQFIGYCAESSWELMDQPSGRSIWAEIPKRLLCFEYVCNKSLDKYISVSMDESSALGWSIRYEIIKGICSGLNFLHEECRIVHLDLKPENILMDASMIPKIADFGLSRIFGTRQSRIVTDNPAGSRGYMAPEYLIQGVVSMKADIFSFGVIVIELITGHRDYPYFQPDDPRGTVASCQHFIEKVVGSWRNKIESTSKDKSMEIYVQQVKQCVTIALKCVNPDMEKRPMAKDIVQVLNEVDQMEANNELPSEMQCKGTSLVLDSTVSKGLIPNSITENISNIETDGTAGDVKKSHECLLQTPLWTSSTGSQSHQEPAKESSEQQQASDKTSEMEAHQVVSSDMKFTDKLLVLNTTASKNLSPSVTEGMLINKTDGKVLDEAKLNEGLSPMFLPESRICNQSYQEGPKASREPHTTCDRSHTTTESEVITGSSMILDIHPRELHFRFEPNKLVACSLNLTNNTDEQVAFGLLKKSDEQTCFLSSLPMFGIVDPRTKYTFVVIMNKHQNPPQERNIDLILQTSTYSIDNFWQLFNNVEDRSMQHFQYAKEWGNTVHKLTLKAVCALQGEMIFERSIPPSIKVIWREGYRISTMDVNQTEPLIITGSLAGYVDIWNYDTQEFMGEVKIPNRSDDTAARSVKFIARKGWFLVGSSDGSIYVYDYKKDMQKITSIKTHSGYCYFYSLAIHPTQPYVLSASTRGMKLWDWDRRWFGWKCMQTFEENSDVAHAVAFNPKDYNSFANTSGGWTVKVWSLDSPKSKYTLSGHSSSVRSLDFFTRDCQQYLITGSEDNTAKIWDMEKKECVCTLPHRSQVFSVLSHPKLPVLVTGTKDGHVHLWSSINFRLKRILNICGISPVRGLASLNDSGRVAVAHETGLHVIEISDEEEHGDSSSNNENSISLAD